MTPKSRLQNHRHTREAPSRWERLEKAAEARACGFWNARLRSVGLNLRAMGEPRQDLEQGRKKPQETE